MDQIRSIIDSITLSDVATWALVVLVAGFIGQFGRKFAEYLIERAKKRRAEAPGEGAAAENRSRAPETGSGAVDMPLKVEGPGIASTDTAEELNPPTNDKDAKERSKQEKKAAKALIKQKKKATPSE